MGRDKATLEVDGVPMAMRVAAALRGAGASGVIAVGGSSPALSALGLHAVPDDEPGAGPLPATLTALRHAPLDLVAVLSCDLVAPSADAISAIVIALAEAPDDDVGAVPLVAGELQWTHAAWRATALPALDEARRQGARSLRRACAGLPITHVRGVAPSAVADADRPGDLPGAG
jgi:molybdopterin-guanine dinucleotide biosynthesis protein A